MERIDTSVSDESQSPPRSHRDVGKLPRREPAHRPMVQLNLPKHPTSQHEATERVDTSTETDDVQEVGRPRTKAAQGKKTNTATRKPRKLPLLKRKREDARNAIGDGDSNGGVSPEAARIEAARAEWHKRLPKASDTPRIASSCSDTTDSAVDGASMARGEPTTSGVFDYVEWVINNCLSLHEREALCSKCPISVGSMCSGMGTEDIALRAIERAMMTCGQDGFQTVSTFKAESDPRKAEFLCRHCGRNTQIFADNAALANNIPINIHGTPVERPLCKILTCGIVCVDISGLSQSPKPISGHGKSGLALQGLLQSLCAMPFEDRPNMLILECVARLGQRRRVDPDNITGTQYVTEELGKLGYVGRWCKVRPRHFFLPQSRPRVYAILLKRTDLSEASATARKQDVDEAFKVIERMQTTTPESLEVLLDRVPKREDHTSTSQRAKKSQTRAEAGGSNRKWPSAHAAFAEKHGLTAAEREIPTDFVSEVANLISARAMDAIWLKVAAWCKRTRQDWNQVLLVLAHDFSVSFASVRPNVFPCVTPSHRYVILQRGQARLSDGFTTLALQGIQSKEMNSFELGAEDDTLLRDLSGNAFTANIIAAFLIAGMLVV